MKKQKNSFGIYGKETIISKLKISIILFSVFLFQTNSLSAQSKLYDNFEGTKVLNYSSRNGVLDSVVKNPKSNSLNSSEKCALYIRNSGKKFDNIKMNLSANLSDVSVKQYSTYLGIPPKIKMKVYTTAPAGTLVEILLGSKSRNNSYPEGTNSQYQAYTTVSNDWEELEFKFAQIPEGSQTTSDQIDQITLLFSPNSSSSDTYYFDDLTGPSLVSETKESATPEIQTTKK